MTGDPAGAAARSPRGRRRPTTASAARRSWRSALLPASEEAEQLALARLGTRTSRCCSPRSRSSRRREPGHRRRRSRPTTALVGHSDDRVRAAARSRSPPAARPSRSPSSPSGSRTPPSASGPPRSADWRPRRKPHGDAIVLKGPRGARSTPRCGSPPSSRSRCSPASAARCLDLSAFIDDRDAGVRDAALVAHAWLNGPAARPALDQRRRGRKRGPARQAREGDPPDSRGLRPSSRSGCCGPSSRSCSTTRASPRPGTSTSSRTSRSSSRSGSRTRSRSTGEAAVGGERSRRGRRARVPPRLEDLRRHLDVFPYSDLRSSLEVPLLRMNRSVARGGWLPRSTGPSCRRPNARPSPAPVSSIEVILPPRGRPLSLPALHRLAQDRDRVAVLHHGGRHREHRRRRRDGRLPGPDQEPPARHRVGPHDHAQRASRRSTTSRGSRELAGDMAEKRRPDRRARAAPLRARDHRRTRAGAGGPLARGPDSTPSGSSASTTSSRSRCSRSSSMLTDLRPEDEELPHAPRGPRGPVPRAARARRGHRQQPRAVAEAQARATGSSS